VAQPLERAARLLGAKGGIGPQVAVLGAISAPSRGHTGREAKWPSEGPSRGQGQAQCLRTEFVRLFSTQTGYAQLDVCKVALRGAIAATLSKGPLAAGASSVADGAGRWPFEGPTSRNPTAQQYCRVGRSPTGAKARRQLRSAYPQRSQSLGHLYEFGRDDQEVGHQLLCLCLRSDSQAQHYSFSRTGPYQPGCQSTCPVIPPFLRRYVNGTKWHRQSHYSRRAAPPCAQSSRHRVDANSAQRPSATQPALAIAGSGPCAITRSRIRAESAEQDHRVL